jgi:pyruvate formate lyase activating enzyme
LERTFNAGREAGLHFVYLGNVPGHMGQDTICPGCGEILIRRTGFGIESASITNGKCPFCATEIYGVWPERVPTGSGQLYRVGI